MKFDPSNVRYLSPEHYRVLTAVEIGSRNHELVPITLVAAISKQRVGGVTKILHDLSNLKLTSRETANGRGNSGAGKYDGVRLCYGGYDYLALKRFSNKESVTSVGNQIGVGKESDIFIGFNEQGESRVLKIHRLGRTSFRTVKANRDYLQHRNSTSWLYLSRLAAEKEFCFMQALKEHNFPVPTSYDQNRHCIVMELCLGQPLYQINRLNNPSWLYDELMQLIIRLATYGLIHGDFNEFNLMIQCSVTINTEDFSTNNNLDANEEADCAFEGTEKIIEAKEITLIDFPQMVSTNHPNAKDYFTRDVDCIRTFFKKKFGFESNNYPSFESALEQPKQVPLDIQLEASGYDKKERRKMLNLAKKLSNITLNAQVSDEFSDTYDQTDETLSNDFDDQDCEK